MTGREWWRCPDKLMHDLQRIFSKLKLLIVLFGGAFCYPFPD